MNIEIIYHFILIILIIGNLSFNLHILMRKLLDDRPFIENNPTVLCYINVIIILFFKIHSSYYGEYFFKIGFICNIAGLSIPVLSLIYFISFLPIGFMKGQRLFSMEEPNSYNSVFFILLSMIISFIFIIINASSFINNKIIPPLDNLAWERVLFAYFNILGYYIIFIVLGLFVLTKKCKNTLIQKIQAITIILLLVIIAIMIYFKASYNDYYYHKETDFLKHIAYDILLFLIFQFGLSLRIREQANYDLKYNYSQINIAFFLGVIFVSSIPFIYNLIVKLSSVSSHNVIAILSAIISAVVTIVLKNLLNVKKMKNE